LSRIGKKVLLIDGDMRSPSIGGIMNLPNTRGLSNYLAGDDDWQALTQRSSIEGLDIMTAGKTPPSAAELLTGSRLSTLVAMANEIYDHVVIDSPPVLGITDAPLIGNAVESMVYIVESMGTPIRGIKDSMQRLLVANVRLSGVVVTKMKYTGSGYGYGYGYGYSYGKPYGSETSLRNGSQ
jgi:capsular exopolysaccharide synthesis family protein